MAETQIPRRVAIVQKKIPIAGMPICAKIPIAVISSYAKINIFEDLASEWKALSDTYGVDKIRNRKHTMEHTALLGGKEKTWKLQVMTRKKGGKRLQVDDVYRKLKTNIKSNEVIVDMENWRFDDSMGFAVFGKAGADAEKRAQILVFGSTPTVCEEWQTHVMVVDDTYSAMQNALNEQKVKKRHLLRPPASFVHKVNSDEDISVSVQNLDSAWLTLDDTLKLVNPSVGVVFTFGHVNTNKTGFYCEFELAQGENKLVMDLYEMFVKKKPKFVANAGPGTLPDKGTCTVLSGRAKPTCGRLFSKVQPLTWINGQQAVVYGE